MDKMDWDDIRVFLAIARAGTLGAAAKEAGQTQPTMGRRLRGLEASVGHNLFQRTAEGFVLTEEGTALLLHAERMEQEALSIDRLLTGQAMGITGTLRISSSDWFGAHVLTKIFSEFLAQHPQVSIELVTDSRLFSLTRREADLAFRITPFKEADIIQRKLMHMNYALYGPTGCVHPSAADGQGHAVITMDSAMRVRSSVAIIVRSKHECALTEPDSPSYRVPSATKRPALSGSTSAKLLRAGMYGSGTTVICVASRGCANC
jgi:DNA-binding transcriptional LysR family regulator